FSDPEWEANPAFNFMRRAWMLNAEWLQGLVDSVSDELDDTTKLKARYYLSQFVDAMSPTNLMTTNPAALRAMIETNGQSVLDGLRNAREDMQRGGGRLAITQTDETAYEIGKNVATAKGRVIFRNKLIEIIHYNPTRKKMRARPMLIFPPWINKFYILDLQPENSMIRWLLSKRVNTFVVSWRSADDETKNYTWDDYIEHGILAAIDAVTKETGAEDINTVGYCIGGTLLSTALAHMGKEGDDRIHSATYFASQSDFDLAGELKIFTDETALKQVDSVINEHDGIMPGEIMGETFNWLRPADLVWRYVVDNYMMGKQPRPFDLLYWNADQTNIPGPTHRKYLKSFYNENALSEGRFTVFGEPVSMSDIDIPVFIQASRSDHICPWHSIYKGAQNFGGPVQFALAGSGHIAGVINHPNAQKYQHWINEDELPDNPGRWLSGAE
ncbi:MAG: alpha/beta fold hydrolase, partial [Pseudomonadota bacterium]